MPASSACAFVVWTLLAWLSAATAPAAVRVIVGPTPIVGGDARGAGDITVVNDRLAFALGVDTAVPYGVPRGAIIDVAPVVGGVIGRDRVVFADFIPNNWSAWPNTYHRIAILERGPRQVRVRTQRDWGRVAIDTVYTLREHSDLIQIDTSMTNRGDVVLTGLLSGMTLWPRGGYVFPVPGLAGVAHGAASGALAERVVAYDEDWSVALHAPYMTHISHASLDLYQLHTLAPGQTRVFSAALQVGASGDLAPVVRAELRRHALQGGALRGRVTTRDAQPVATPVVVVEREGKPFAWTLGHDGAYGLELAAGDYTVYATAKGHSQSARTTLHVGSGRDTTLDFTDLDGPGELAIDVVDAGSGRPVDARITITQGQQPLVEFLGRRTFFTQLAQPGHVELSIAPGAYTFAVGAGGGFLGPAAALRTDVATGQKQVNRVAVEQWFSPRERHWYAADLHHHADQAEAVTPPADLARSQFAAGLDLLFVGDHDSTVNHAALMQIAGRRAVPFIAGVELSPSWGHFNAYPLAPGEPLRIDTSTATIDQVIAEARRLGALVVQANHPFIPYGYFASLEAGVAPGGFNPGFDLVEMNADVGDEPRIFERMGRFWNAGHRYYLSAGTDTHDVWNAVSGRLRVLAHVDGTLDAASFARALLAGHAYVTSGPLVYPSVVFGEQLKVRPGTPFKLSFDLESVAGLRSARLVTGNGDAGLRSWDAAPRRERVEFTLATEQPAWFALVVEDAAGHHAYTNPIWVDTVSDAGGAAPAAPAGRPGP